MKNLEKLICSLNKGEFLSVAVEHNTEKVNEDLYKKVNGMPNPMIGRVTRCVEYQGVRFCDYERMADVVAERADGKEPKKPWYEWVVFPFIADGKKNGKRYMVVKPTPNTTYKETFFVDGVEVEYAEIAQYFKAKTPYNRVITLQLDFIKRIKQGDILYK